MQRFFDKIEISESGCWTWKGAKRGNGYGCMKILGKVESAHRVSYELHFAKIPEGMLVCHKCDNRICVNPQHLFLGTYSDNMKDCFNKGRLQTPDVSRFKNGNKPSGRSISELKARHIKRLISERGKRTLIDIATKEKLPYQLIRDISCQRIYKNV